MFWALVLGFGVQLRTLASLRRTYKEKGEVHISRGSFYERFTPELWSFSMPVSFMDWRTSRRDPIEY